MGIDEFNVNNLFYETYGCLNNTDNFKFRLWQFYIKWDWKQWMLK